MKTSSCAAKIRCVREHFSYCAAAHPRSLKVTMETGEFHCYLTPSAPCM